MSMLQRYLAKLLILRWTLIAFGIGSLVLVLDLMVNSDSVLERDGAGLGSLLRYMYLRFPIILERIFPFSILLAALLTLIQLTFRRELVAMMAAGVSQFSLLMAFAPVIVVMAAVDFVVGDQLSPWATAQLKDWGVGSFARKEKKIGAAAIWVRDGNQIIRIGSVAPGGELTSVTIFQRHPNGNLARKLNADRAIFENDVWRLKTVRGYEIDTLEETRATELEWKASLRPSSVLALATDPRELTLGELTRISRRSDFGSHPGYVYEVWRQRKFAQPIVIVVIFLLIIPLVQRFQRQDNAPLIVLTGVIGGFVFFALDGLLVSMGAAGVLPPVVAAWAATAIFGLLGLTMAAHRELM